MTVYIDALLFLNFYLDFLLLLSTSLILKRFVKPFRLVFASFIGSLTILVLFLDISSAELFLIKIYFSLLMCLISFGFSNVKTFFINVFTFYIVSIILGGFLYFLNITITFKHQGLIFYNSGLKLNILLIIVISPVILYFYFRQMKMFRKRLAYTFKTKIYIGRQVLNLTGYLDTGNTLTYKNRPVILTNIDNNFPVKKIYIPYIVIGGGGLIECIKVRKVEVDSLGVFENVYLGFSDSFNIAGADVLLNGNMGGE